MNTPYWRPLPTKLRLYEALYSLNRGFAATLLSLEQLEGLGMFRLENLNAFKVSVEHLRARANDEVVRTLQEYEEGESARFEQMESEWERQRGDPDDVLFAAENRKAEIRQQMKALQRGLERHGQKRKARRKRR